MAKPKHSREPKLKKSSKEDKDSTTVSSNEFEETPAPVTKPAATKPAAAAPGKAKTNPGRTSNSENSLAIAGNVKPNVDAKMVTGASDESERPPQNTVRSSLTLLKNKGPRRRASLANNQPSQDEEFSPMSQHVVPSSSQSNNHMRNSEDFNEYEEQNNRYDNNQATQRKPQPMPAFKQQTGFGHHHEESFQEEEEDEEEPDQHGEEYGDHDEEDQEGQSGQAGYHDFEDDPDANYQPDGNTMECPDCGRHFLPEPFSRHVKICKKVFASKRKVFDSSKKRIEAIPELKSLLETKKRFVGTKKQASQTNNTAAASKNKWKEQSMAFREAMRAARQYSSGKDDDVIQDKPKTPYIDPSLIQCPNCQRRFNEKAAERHIPVCKSIIAKPSVLKKGSGIQASTAVTTPNPTVKSSTMKRGWN